MEHRTRTTTVAEETGVEGIETEDAAKADLVIATPVEVTGVAVVVLMDQLLHCRPRRSDVVETSLRIDGIEIAMEAGVGKEERGTSDNE